MRMISSDGYLEGITVFPNMLHALTLPLYLANHIQQVSVLKLVGKIPIMTLSTETITCYSRYGKLVISNKRDPEEKTVSFHFLRWESKE